MEYIQEITLDINANSAYTTLAAKQGDNGARQVIVHLTKDNVPTLVDASSRISFRCRKPDGHGVINPASVLTEGENAGSILVTLTAETLRVPGRAYADIVVYDGATNNTLSSASFILIIVAAPDVASNAISSDEFGYLNSIVESANLTITEAEAWAVGRRGGTPVSEYYIDYDVNVNNFEVKKGYLYIYDEDTQEYISAADRSFDPEATYYVKDDTLDNNSKYYSIQAKQEANFLKELAVTAVEGDEAQVVKTLGYSVANPQPTAENFDQDVYYIKNQNDEYVQAETYDSEQTYYIYGYKFDFTLPPGATGPTGTDGFSPTVSVQSTSGTLEESDIIQTGNIVTITYHDQAAAANTSFVVWDGLSDVAISNRPPTSSDIGAHANVWIYNGSEITGEISANNVSYDSDTTYLNGTVGKALNQVDTAIVEAAAAKSSAVEAVNEAEAAFTAATLAVTEVGKKITNPAISSTDQSVLTNKLTPDTTVTADNFDSKKADLYIYDEDTQKYISAAESSYEAGVTYYKEVINWSNTLQHIAMFEDAPEIEINGTGEEVESIPLSGTKTPVEFGLAPRNPDTDDGSYYSKPPNGIFNDLTIQAQKKIDNTVHFLTDVTINHDIKGTRSNFTIDTQSTGTGFSAWFANENDENIFLNQINYQLGSYSFIYAGGQWEFQQEAIESLDDYGISTTAGYEFEDNDAIIVTYKPTINLDGIQTTNIIKNKNLLDNGWFSVNQRNISNYDDENITASTYICDRWKIGNIETGERQFDGRYSISVEPGFLRITTNESFAGISSDNKCTIVQILDPETAEYIEDEAVTLSVKFSGENINTQIVNKSTEHFVGELRVPLIGKWYTRIYHHDNGSIICEIGTETGEPININIQAVKLELGLQSTLNLDLMPVYSEELLRCQRYYIQYDQPEVGETPLTLGRGYSNSATELIWEIPLKVSLVKMPQITTSVTDALLTPMQGTTARSMTGNQLAASSFFLGTGNIIYVKTTVASYTSYRDHFIQFAAATDSEAELKWFAFSAEPTLILPPPDEPIEEEQS